MWEGAERAHELGRARKTRNGRASEKSKRDQARYQAPEGFAKSPPMETTRVPPPLTPLPSRHENRQTSVDGRRQL